MSLQRVLLMLKQLLLPKVLLLTAKLVSLLMVLLQEL